MWSFDKLLSLRNIIPKSDKKKHALLEEKIIYTSIILPNLNAQKLIGLFVKTSKRIAAGEFKAQEVTFTGNLPSALDETFRYERRVNEHAYVIRDVVATLTLPQNPCAARSATVSNDTVLYCRFTPRLQ